MNFITDHIADLITKLINWYCKLEFFYKSLFTPVAFMFTGLFVLYAMLIPTYGMNDTLPNWANISFIILFVITLLMAGIFYFVGKRRKLLY